MVTCPLRTRGLNVIEHALIAQLVEHLTCNQGVRRSSRRGGTITFPTNQISVKPLFHGR